MYALGVSEFITRFIGHWEVSEDWGYWSTWYAPGDADPQKPELVWVGRDLFRGNAKDLELGAGARDVDLKGFPLADLPSTGIGGSRFFTPAQLGDLPARLEALEPQGAFGFSTGFIQINGEIVTPAVYSYGEDGGVSVVITQTNFTWDNDILIQGEFSIGVVYNLQISQASTEFVESAYALVSDANEASMMSSNALAEQLAETLTSVSMSMVASYGILTDEAYAEILAQRRLEMEEAAENGGAIGPEAVTTVSSIWVNGQESEATSAPDLEGYVTVAPLDDMDSRFDDPALGVLEVGGNTAINNATVVDGPETFGSLMVHGNYYDMSAIVQLNILHDGDTLPAGVLAPPEMTTQEFVDSLVQQQTVFTSMMQGASAAQQTASSNTMDNYARFDTVVEAPPPTEMPLLQAGAGASGSLWTIDYSWGDFFDVSRLTQINHIIDNDVVGQIELTDNKSFLIGDNYSENTSLFIEISGNYDLIIVGGDYFEMSYICQKNIIFDADYIQGLGQAFESDQMTSSFSGNTLINSASIGDAGTPIAFDYMSESAAQLSALIEAGETNLDALLTSMFSGYAGQPFNVLYVSGNYYDTTAIFQTNVIEDADAVAVGAQAEATTSLSVSTGSNVAINNASIVDYDSAGELKMLAGDHYEDSFLMQANLLPEDLENAQDMDALASEVVVFAVEGSTEETITGDSAEIVKPDMTNDDMFSSVLA